MKMVINKYGHYTTTQLDPWIDKNSQLHVFIGTMVTKFAGDRRISKELIINVKSTMRVGNCIKHLYYIKKVKKQWTYYVRILRLQKCVQIKNILRLWPGF